MWRKPQAGPSLSVVSGRLDTVPPARRSAQPTTTWDRVELAPLVLVRGKEGLLVERAVASLARQARARAQEAEPGAVVEVTRLEAAQYQQGRLAVLASPSLFAEPRHLEITGLEALNDACATDLLAYLSDPAPDVTLVLTHASGVRGKKVLEAVQAAGAVLVQCDEIPDREKAGFVSGEFARARRRIAADAVVALVQAVGSDLRELAAAAAQLISDTTGTVGVDVVDRYYGGRVEATGFRVADAAVAGHEGEALALVRHSMASGTDPVPLVAAIALKLRTMAKVAGSSNRPGALSGLAPWQIDRARKELRGWTPEGLASAILAVAAADAEVKGEGRSASFAIERAVRRVAQARGTR